MAFVRVVRKSVDARRGRVRVRLLLELCPTRPDPRPPAQPRALAAVTGTPEVIIVGAGPAGLMCALTLAQRGVRTLIVERGQAVPQRRRDVATLAQRGQLDTESNYCFGEGGAGTFSDGKLYTRARKRGPVRAILEALVQYGAPVDILVDARPHIGTNRLPTVIERLRTHLQDAGHQLLFGARVTDLMRRGRHVCGVTLADGSSLEARAVVLATGHSASDVYHLLARQGATMQTKSFAVGVRVEHPQAFVDRTQYGDLAGHPALGSATYRLVEQGCGAAVFSFCMCPGGFIVPAATHVGRQVVNGWSPYSRRGRFANSGLVVEVGPAQLRAAGLNPEDPFAGLAFQAALEQRAYEAGGGEYVAPAQRLSDFIRGERSTSLPRCSYPRGLQSAVMNQVLQGLAEPMVAALAAIDRKLPGFAGDEGVAVGVESRTSAPIRIQRDPSDLQAPELPGLYPAAEGAGYAGGIMSAALDGRRIALTLARALREK